MKEKLFWLGMVVVIFSWFANYLYYESKQIDQNIFLEHYYEIYLQDETFVTFYYLSNKADRSRVSYAVLDGVEVYPVSDEGFWNDDSPTPKFEQEFSHQYLKSVRLQLPQHVLPLEAGTDNSWSFDEISFVFSDGQTVTANIGKVIVYGKLPNFDMLEMRVSSSSNQHREEESMVATTPLTVEAIKVPFSEYIVEDVFVKVNVNQKTLKKLETLMIGGDRPAWFEDRMNVEWNEVEGIAITDDIFPFKLEKNDWLQLSMLFNPERKSYFDFGVEIIGKTAEGEPFIRKSHINDHPFLTQQGVNEIISENKGEMKK
ncbi:hypothetical protein [Calidifontibacillus oryziterrae]|uniref:hypothetical protein n=1 Tax=Calidifontibacillus oryziterrae TaxID=1191699 RepID=UPI0003709CAF|nr:hypothetical protein [Calidifontibacillus oryziterrae]